MQHCNLIGDREVLRYVHSINLVARSRIEWSFQNSTKFFVRAIGQEKKCLPRISISLVVFTKTLLQQFCPLVTETGDVMIPVYDAFGRV